MTVQFAAEQVFSLRGIGTLALSEHQPRVVLDVLNNPRFVNDARQRPNAQRPDEGRYIASVRSTFRLLKGCSAAHERSDQFVARSMQSRSCWQSWPTGCGAGISQN